MAPLGEGGGGMAAFGRGHGGLRMREIPHPCTMCTYPLCSDSGAVSFWYIYDPIYSSLESVSKVWAPFLQLGVCEAPGDEMTLTQSQCPPRVGIWLKVWASLCGVACEEAREP